MKKISFLIPVLSFLSIAMYGQEIKFETSVVTNSVALHPMIFDVDKDGKNDIVVVDDYLGTEGNDALNIKTVSWFSYQGKDGAKSMYDWACERKEQILATYKPEPIDRHLAKEIDEIVAAVIKELANN